MGRCRAGVYVQFLPFLAPTACAILGLCLEHMLKPTVLISGSSHPPRVQRQEFKSRSSQSATLALNLIVHSSRFILEIEEHLIRTSKVKLHDPM
jgi:hypothetical protein